MKALDSINLKQTDCVAGKVEAATSKSTKTQSIMIKYAKYCGVRYLHNF